MHFFTFNLSEIGMGLKINVVRNHCISSIGSLPLSFLVIYKIIVHLLIESVLNSVKYNYIGAFHYLSVLMHRTSYIQVWHQLYYFIITALTEDFTPKVFQWHILI